MHQNRLEARRHFRIFYPLRLRASLEWADVSVEVIDVSESGLRIIHSPDWCWLPGETAGGVVKFRCGKTVYVSGSVVRLTPTDVALSFARGLSFGIILSEQRALRHHRPYLSLGAARV